MSSVKVSLSQYKQPILVIITIIQVIIMLYYFKIENSIQDVKEVNYAVPTKLTFNEISNDINIDKNIEILEVEDLGEKWYVKIMLNGNNKKIKEIINKLEKFEIYNYDISGKDNILTVILELYR
ncbi:MULTISPECIES: hypothetical protein [unclassified Clostridium]|uniref:hypothetical protein n=1 Tax=unclassified Clostridium TaxID=2614128 RepID=UPI0018974D6A|nr:MULTISPECIES: hypothetical protein [unclassified Clostridium]MBP3915126.1 hypothetical protein [Clostridium sp.]MEE0932729.1 hypothetical protein [Clostridium sp.]